MIKPLILISAFREPSAKGGDLERDCAESTYIQSIIQSGGNPLIVPHGLTHEDASYLAIIADGLLLPGGVDVHSSHYGEEPHESTKDFSENRDALELTLIKVFLENKKPIFGICRGAQILNVALGGNLYQDIKSQIGTPVKHWVSEEENVAQRYTEDSHTIKIQKNTLLDKFLGEGDRTVNSLHHQAIKNVGEGLCVSAYSDDGIIEAVESTDMKKCWLLGVQWHPEAIREIHRENKNLFDRFIEASKREV